MSEEKARPEGLCVCNDSILSGDIRHFRLPEILQLLSLQKLTGRLMLESSGRAVNIYIRNGGIVFASGDDRRACEQMGHILIMMGRLDESRLDDALRESAGSGDRLGAVLVRSGLVGTGDIRLALEKQTERAVHKAVAWSEGRFQFLQGGMPGFVEDAGFSISVDGIILEGIRQIGEGRRIAEKIPSLDLVFVRAEHATQAELRDDERKVLARVDGKTSVGAILDTAGMDEMRVMRAMYALHLAGFIKREGQDVRQHKTDYL